MDFVRQLGETNKFDGLIYAYQNERNTSQVLTSFLQQIIGLKLPTAKPTVIAIYFKNK